MTGAKINLTIKEHSLMYYDFMNDILEHKGSTNDKLYEAFNESIDYYLDEGELTEDEAEELWFLVGKYL